MSETYDVIIVGGGPAGLSAALVLGRCRRSVLVYDDGRPRNRTSPAAHCLLGNEGIAPSELIAKSRLELREYERVVLLDDKVLRSRSPIADLAPLVRADLSPPNERSC